MDLLLAMSRRPAVPRAKLVGIEAVQPATKEMLQSPWYAQADGFVRDETRVR